MLLRHTTSPKGPLSDFLGAPVNPGSGQAWDGGAGGSRWSPLSLGAKATVFTPPSVISGNPIDSIANLGSAGGSYSQALTLRPAVGTIAGVAAADYDGSNDRLEGGPAGTNVISAGAYHGFAAVNLDAIILQRAIGTLSPSEQCIFCDVSQFFWVGFRDVDTTAGTDYRVAAGHWDGANKEVFSNAGDLSLSTDTLIEWRFDGSGIYVRVGANAERGPAAAGNVTTLTGATQLGADASDVQFVNGRLGTVVVCNAVLSATERANVRAWYQATYPGIAA